MNRISICLTDLAKDKIKKANNGKLYINLVVAERKEPDQFGNDLVVYSDQTKEEREAKAEKNYVGSGRVIHFNPNNPEGVSQLPSLDDSEPLPWANSAEFDSTNS